MKSLFITITLLFTVPSFAENVFCYKSDLSYYCKTPKKTVWCYPSGQQYYCPGTDITVWCQPIKTKNNKITHYCPTPNGNWYFLNQITTN